MHEYISHTCGYFLLLKLFTWIILCVPPINGQKILRSAYLFHTLLYFFVILQFFRMLKSTTDIGGHYSHVIKQMCLYPHRKDMNF